MKLSKSICVFFVIVLSQLNVNSQVYDSSDLYLEEARKSDKNQNFTRAAKMSWRGLQISPNDLDLKTILGKANLQLGRYDTARWVLREVYERRRKDPEVLHFLVNIEESTKRYSDAICFINELLEITPYWKGLWIRKITIYKEMGNFEEAERALDRIRQIYPDDKDLNDEYNYIMLENGNKAIDTRDFKEANKIYTTIIDETPDNIDAYKGIIKNELLKGNKEYALQYTNRALMESPNNLVFVEKKIGLLQELGRHAEAITYINSLDKLPQFNQIRTTTLPFLLQESASFNQYNDAYEVNKKLVEINGNSESQNYVINNALGKEYHTDAEYFINKALKKNPNSKELLVKQMQLYKPFKDADKYEKLVIANHEKFPNDTDIKYAVDEIMFKRAKQHIANKEYDAALEIFTELISSPDFTKEAEENIFAILLFQNRFDEASEQIDKLIGLDSNNPDYLLKKSTLYQRMELYDDALEITRSLETQYPLNQKYTQVYIDQTTDYARYLMREQRYAQVLPVVEDGLTRENNNKDLLDLAINASSAIPDYPKGINYGLSALSFYPKNKSFKLKLSSLYSKNEEYDKAFAVLDSLKKTYPFDRKLKNSLAEVLFNRAKSKEEQGLVDAALEDYDSSFVLNPNDDGALTRMTNLHIDKKTYNESLDFLNQKLRRNPDNNLLKFKKGVVFELLKEYDSAYYYQKFKVTDNPYDLEEWKRNLETLQAENLRNSLAATYLEASSDSVAFNTSLASLNFTRTYDKNTYGADINYAARTSGVGIQGGLNVSRILTETIYADVGFLLGSRFFPKFKIYGNAYKGFKNGYEAQVGLSFARLQNDQNYITLSLGAARTWDDIWVNARLSLSNTNVEQFERDPATGDIITQSVTDPNTGLVSIENVTFSQNVFYTNLMIQTRITVNARKDYFSLIASGGSAPFDQQLEFQENTFLNFSNVMIGAGYKYNMTPKTSLLVDGTWINFKSNQSTLFDSTTGQVTILDSIFTNQYNLSLTLATRF
jgi:tetratricopeptide (TPR) repeat protein